MFINPWLCRGVERKSVFIFHAEIHQIGDPFDARLTKFFR